MAIDLLSLYEPGRGKDAGASVAPSATTGASASPGRAVRDTEPGDPGLVDRGDLDDTLVLDAVPLADIGSVLDGDIHAVIDAAAEHALRTTDDDLAFLPALGMVPVGLHLQLAAVMRAYEDEVAAHTRTVHALHSSQNRELDAASTAARERTRRITEQEHRFREREELGATIQRLNSDVAGLEDLVATTRNERDRFHRHAMTLGITTAVAVAGGLVGSLLF